jgi:hypothetical protein
MLDQHAATLALVDLGANLGGKDHLLGHVEGSDIQDTHLMALGEQIVHPGHRAQQYEPPELRREVICEHTARTIASGGEEMEIKIITVSSVAPVAQQTTLHFKHGSAEAEAVNGSRLVQQVVPA